HPFSWYPWYPWYLPSAGAINAAGQIVGGGYHTGGSNGNGSIVYRVQLPPGEAAVCQARDVCGAGDTDSVCLFSDGVVDLPDGRLVAIFGFDNASSTSVQPTQNEVSVNDGPALNNPQPAPPADLAPGTHNGAFLPTFTVNDHKISWTVNGEPVTATVSGPHLPWVPMPGGGIGAVIAGRMIPLPCVGLQDGTHGNDGNACTTGETCQSGLCVGGSAVTCPSDQCHASGTCDPTIGCPPPKPDGTACDDANVCTQTETCEAGTCREPSPQLPVVVNLPIVDF